MKVRIEKKSDEEMRQKYPIAGRLKHWYFRSAEISNNAWLVEGCDIWGRTVSRRGDDPDELLAKCIEHAETVEPPS